MAIPLEWRSITNSAQSAVSNAVPPKLRSLEIPGKSVEMGVRVTRGAGELALEAIAGRVVNPFAPAQGRQFPGPPKVERGGDPESGEINNGQRVFQPVGDIGRPAIG